MMQNERASTWAGATYKNNTGSSVRISNLYESLVCSGSSVPIVKSWGPFTIPARGVMTSTVSCPSGQTTKKATARFTR